MFNVRKKQDAENLTVKATTSYEAKQSRLVELSHTAYTAQDAASYL
jgi:hypothetical protein